MYDRAWKRPNAVAKQKYYLIYHYYEYCNDYVYTKNGACCVLKSEHLTGNYTTLSVIMMLEYRGSKNHQIPETR